MRRLLALPILLAACGAPSHPTPAPAPEPTIDSTKLDAELTPWISAHGATWGETHALSGYVLVTQHGQPVYAHAFGYADRDHKAVADADTSFRIGSVTKQFTATAILLLQQDGKLSTKDPIEKYLPDYPAVGADITLHQLLTHTSGIPNYTDLPDFATTMGQPTTPAKLMALFDAMPLEFAPGSAWRYSNSNYIVLGAIIEKVSGMSYADFVAKRLFAPAGMKDTVVGDAAGRADRALGYDPSGDALAPAQSIDMTVPFAAGAVRSTANDLVRWAQALDGDKLLTAASKAELYTPDKANYAYGWFVDRIDGHQEYWHDGGIPGFATDYRRIPDLDLVVVAWSNNSGFDVGGIGKAAVDAATGTALAKYTEPAKGSLDVASAARAVGNFTLTQASRAGASKLGLADAQLASIATIDLTVKDGHLVLKPIGQPEVALDAASPTQYFASALGLTVDVTLPDDGGFATQVVLTQGPLSLTYAPTPTGR